MRLRLISPAPIEVVMNSPLLPVHMRSISGMFPACGTVDDADILPPIEFEGLVAAAPDKCCVECLDIYATVQWYTSQVIDAGLPGVPKIVKSVRFLDGRD